MKKFSNVSPLDVHNDPRVVFEYVVFTSDEKDEDYLFLLIDSNYLIFVTRSVYVNKNNTGLIKKLVGGTKLEVPKESLLWFVNVIEEKFFKSEIDGGLPKGEFGYEEEIKGERLIVSRMFGTPGYSFRNHSRHSYLFEDSTDPQDLPLSDELLFEKSLFDELKKIANKIENGDL